MNLPSDREGFAVVASKFQPIIYVSETIHEEDIYRVWKIDCTLQNDKPKQELYHRSLDANFENCGDGVDGFNIVENEHGRILQIPLLGTGDCGFNAYDINADKVIANLHFSSEFDYRSIQYNPGTSFYCFEHEEGYGK